MTELTDMMRRLRDRRAPHISDKQIDIAARDVDGDVESLGKLFGRLGKAVSSEDLSTLYLIRTEALATTAESGPDRRSEQGRVAVGTTERIEPLPPPPPPVRSPAHAAPDQGQDRATPPSPTGPTPVGTNATTGPVPSDDQLPDLDSFSVDCNVFDSTDTRLRLINRGDRITAGWAPASVDPSQRAIYLVCMAKSGVPNRPEEHLRLLATTRTTADIPATAQFVAVFLYRVSDPAMVAFETCIRHAVGRVLREVQDLDVKPAVHGVLLQWKRPAGVERVQVMRSRPDEELPDIADNSLLLQFTGDHVRDTDVVPGATYQYRISTEAAALGASADIIETSKGIIREVTVPATPEAVEDLKGSLVQRGPDPGITLSWPVVGRGKVSIYERTGTPGMEMPVDTVLTTEQFARWNTPEELGVRIVDPAARDGDREGIDWLPLAGRPTRGDEPRRTYTAVTEFAGQYVIGAHRVITFIGAVAEAEIDERVDWQLLRSTWPVGATFLGVWLVRQGEDVSGEPHRKVTKDEFIKYGGVAFVSLPFSGCDVVVQGATRYGSSWATGASLRITYPGRWVLRYQLAASGRLGMSRVLRVSVERPDWPDLSMTLASDPSAFPLSPQDPDLSVLYSGQLAAGTLPPGDLVTVSGEFKVRRSDTFTRLFVSAPGIRPIVVDPLPPAAGTPAAPRPQGLRCPRCLLISKLDVQFFACIGSCQPELNHPQSRLLAEEVYRRHVFPVIRTTEVRGKQVVGPPVDTGLCNQCGSASDVHLCAHCHSVLPPQWWAHEVLGVTVIGARSSGKTSYLGVLPRYLEENLLPSIQGHMHPVDARSEQKLTNIRQGLLAGKLESSTVGNASNKDILEPILLDIGQGPSGRTRTLSIFDVAGEDMAVADSVRPYGTAMAGSDVLLMLIDPLQLDGVRAWLQGSIPLPEQAGVRAATVIQNVAAQIRQRRHLPSGPIPQRVAVAFSKFDGLQDAAQIRDSKFANLIGPGNAMWRDPYLLRPDAVYLDDDGRRMHDEVRALLHRVGEASLVSVVESSFAEVRYLALSALGHAPRGTTVSETGASPHRVGDPLRWLLWSNGWS